MSHTTYSEWTPTSAVTTGRRGQAGDVLVRPTGGEAGLITGSEKTFVVN